MIIRMDEILHQGMLITFYNVAQTMLHLLQPIRSAIGIVVK